MAKRPLVARAFRGCAISVAVAAAGVVLLCGGIWLEHGIAVTLPSPTGPLGVGRTILDWVATTDDSLAPAPGTKREVLAWIWYPAAPVVTQPIAGSYAPAELRGPPGSSNIFTWLTRDLSKVRDPAIPGAGIASGAGPFPVLIMRAGASAPVRNYATLAEDLASHGYVVVGFDAAYRTGAVVFPDSRVVRRPAENDPELCIGRDHARQERCANRILAAWVADIGFALDRLTLLNRADSTRRFTGRLDLARVGVFGHSLGGAAAAQFCHDDPRCRAGVDIDGALHGTVIAEGLRQPFLFLLSDHGSAADSVSREIVADIRSVYDRVPPDARAQVAIRGAFHFTFSDDGALMKSGVVRGVLRVLGMLRIDPRRQLAITAYCLRTFFDATLKRGGARPAFDRVQYPELDVTVDAR